MRRPLLHEGLIMQALPHEITSLILVFVPLFSKGVWSAVQVLLAGAILAVGRRTASAVLRVMGLSAEEQFQKYHRVLNRAKWSTGAASRQLLLLLIDSFVPHGPIVMGLGSAPPAVDLQVSIQAVSSISSSNGIGGTLSTTYRYGELNLDQNGRSLLSFRWMEATQAATGTTMRTEYRQDWPYIGFPSVVKKMLPGGGNAGVLSQVFNT